MVIRVYHLAEWTSRLHTMHLFPTEMNVTSTTIQRLVTHVTCSSVYSNRLKHRMSTRWRTSSHSIFVHITRFLTMYIHLTSSIVSLVRTYLITLNVDPFSRFLARSGLVIIRLAYTVYTHLSEWLCLPTRVWVNVTLQLPSVRQLWHYCTALPVWIYVSLTCNSSRGRGPTTDSAITEGIRPPNLPNLQVLDEAESLLPA